MKQFKTIRHLKRSNLNFARLLIILFFISQNALGAIVYVFSTTGSDTNSGLTLPDPFSTVCKGVMMANQGGFNLKVKSI